VTLRMRRLAPIAVLGISVLALGACGGGDGGGGDGGGAGATTEGGVQLINEGTLTTCTHLPYEPFQFEEGGKTVGFDVDLVDEVAKDLGVTQEIVNIPFETIQSGEALNAGQCDLAAAGMTINEVREENLDFSEPYFDASQALLTKAGSGIDSVEALAGKKLGVQTGTTGQEYAEKNAGDAEIVVFEDLALLLEAVKSGQVDAGINDNGVLFDYVQDNPQVEVTTEFDTGEQYGIGVRTGNTALLDKVDATLERVRSDGTYDQIYAKWFGQAPTS
jgi:polar amino acid transport system substrate-binding protein